MSGAETDPQAGVPRGLEQLVGVWNDYYRDNPGDTVLQDANLFELEVGAIARQVERVIAGRSTISVLELGSATGALAASLVESLEARGVELDYVGVDLSPVACERAMSRRLKQCRFVEADFLSFLSEDVDEYDIVVSQRSIMGILERAEQRRVLALLAARLSPQGLAVLSEATSQALDRCNILRSQLGLEPLATVWHSLALDEEDIRAELRHVEVSDFASLYWLVTRVVYPFFAEPSHNAQIHDFAAQLPQVGDFGYVRLFIGRRA
jgi:SAM-dependent methyltransferase